MEYMRGRDTGSIGKFNKQEPYGLDTEWYNIFLKKYTLRVAPNKSIMILCVHLNRVAWQQK